jgi:hypothetical protein
MQHSKLFLEEGGLEMWRKVVIKTVVTLIVMALGWASVLGQEVETSLSLNPNNFLCNHVESGARIRLLVAPALDPEVSEIQGGENTLTGTLESCKDGVLGVQPKKSETEVILIPSESVQWLEVSQGKSGHALEGALLGLVLGLSVAVATQSGPSDCEGFLCGMDEIGERIAIGTGITLAGILAGVAIGSSIGSEEWERVYDEELHGYFHNRLPGEHRVAVGFSF